LMISCPEEIAYRMGFINSGQVRTLAGQMKNNSYGAYLLHLAEHGL
jgi:glucose-1-phosphate thymidylyltransferase